MNALFDKEKNKMIQIMLYSLDSPKIAFKQMLRDLEISTASAYSYLEQLNTFFISIDDTSYFKTENHMLLFVRSKNFTLHKLLIHLFETSLSSFIFFSIFSEEQSSVSDVAKKASVSRATIYNKIKQLNKWLIPKELKIIYKPLTIVGSEQTIRRFFHELFWTIYKSEKIPLPIEYDKATLEIEIIERQLHNTFSIVEKLWLMHWITILAKRRSQHRFVDGLVPLTFTKRSRRHVIAKREEIPDSFYQNEVHFELSIIESFLVSDHPFSPFLNEFILFHQARHTEEWSIFHEIMDALFQHNIPSFISGNTLLKARVLSLIIRSSNPHFDSTDFIPQLESPQKKCLYLGLFNNLEKALSSSKRSSYYYKIRNKKALVLGIYDALITCSEIKNYEPPIYIRVDVLSWDKKVQIQHKLRTSFPYNILFDTTDASPFTPDLLISDFYLSEFSSYPFEYYLINEAITDFDKIELEKIIYSILHTKIN
ncbi:helix-turn-helix domain-containing protein [Listeria booriae]|uniref:helix-turn-helix domain-containing protein n=1 Tax=Listeria booriae TaxID=1552123 RepID=UPI001623C934|nr:helix-turn-helix domain-containing protein [Listeria booriae]MBC1228648.1 helix-turn-helix domain-containing protein [Listeria booriae]